jgi:hypothetical protein
MKTILNLSEKEVVWKLRGEASMSGVNALAVEMKVSRGYLYDVLNEKRSPGPSILKYLNLERVEVRQIHYRRRRAK